MVDPVLIVEGYLNSVSYPGDDMVDDLMVAAMMVFEQHEDRRIMQELVKLHCDAAKTHKARGIEHWNEVFDGEYAGCWWEDLTYLQGLMVFGDDRLAGHQIAILVRTWDEWYPNHAESAPAWEEVRDTLARVLGDNDGGDPDPGWYLAVERATACTSYVPADDLGGTLTETSGPNMAHRVWAEAHVKRGNQLIPIPGYKHWSINSVDAPMGDLQTANFSTWQEWLASWPYFDCQWAVTDPQSPRGIHYYIWARYERASGIPTLLAYYSEWYYRIATAKNHSPADPELYETLQAVTRRLAEIEQEQELPGGLGVGSYAEGTMRIEDRLPVALGVLRALAPAEHQIAAADMQRIDGEVEDDDWWASEAADWVLEEIVDAVNEILGEHGVYLGSNENDPADFGIWYEIDDWEEDDEEHDDDDDWDWADDLPS